MNLPTHLLIHSSTHLPTYSIRRLMPIVVTDVGRARFMRAVRATIERVVSLYTVADYAAAAVIADRREPVNRTLERIKRVALASRDNIEAQFVIVPTHLAFTHLTLTLKAEGDSLHISSRCYRSRSASVG